jgi:methylmalonyl-CoA carboxyltransferase 1.3S subunit
MDEIWKCFGKGSTLKLQITIDGKAYEVEVEVVEDEEAATPSYTQHATHTAARPNSYGGIWESNGKVCRSPVTGLVIKVNVEPGQSVKEGELMLVLEAMKMETNVTAPHAGIVKNIHVAPGDSVKTNQVLVECE